MYLLIVFVLNIDSLDFLILILNLCIFSINLELQILIKSHGVYSSLFWINVGISRPSRRMWWLLLTLKYKDNRYIFKNKGSITLAFGLFKSMLNVTSWDSILPEKRLNLREAERAQSTNLTCQKSMEKLLLGGGLWPTLTLSKLHH
jgi:hypothetical protein